MAPVQPLQLEGESLDLQVTHCVCEGTGPCPKGWEFFSPGVAQQRVFADCQVILKLIIKPSEREPRGHFPMV